MDTLNCKQGTTMTKKETPVSGKTERNSFNAVTLPKALPEMKMSCATRLVKRESTIDRLLRKWMPFSDLVRLMSSPDGEGL